MRMLGDRRKARLVRKMRFWRKRRSRLDRPRLCVFRSARHIQAQLIDDVSARVLVSASSMEKDVRALGLRGVAMAERIGSLIAERAQEKKIQKVVFDKNGFTYHGRIKALADAARSRGMDF